MKRALLRIAWIAVTPLALTVLLAAPARATPETSDEPTEEAETGGAHGAPVTNPIMNFASWDYKGKEHHGHKVPPPFSMALLNFAVLAVLVGKFAGPSFARMVRERHEGVAKQLAESARLRDEAQAKLDEYTRKLDALQAEVAGIVSGLRAEAEVEKARIIGEAEARAKRMQTEAEQQIQAELQRVRTSLEREAVVTAIVMAQRLLAEKMNDQDQRALAERFVKSLQTGGAAAAGSRT